MKQIFVLSSFERSVKKLNKLQRIALGASLEEFNRYVKTGQASHGLGLKKINHDKYEFRVDIRLRVVFKESDEGYFLVLVGNHDTIRRYLREYRNS